MAALGEGKTNSINPFAFSIFTGVTDSSPSLSCFFPPTPLLLLFFHFAFHGSLPLGGVAAGCAEGNQVLSESQAAHHRSGGEHERLRLSQMQGH